MKIMLLGPLFLLGALATMSMAGEHYVVGTPCVVLDQCKSQEIEDALHEMYQRIGMDVQLVYLPQLRDLEDTNSLAIDASAARSKKSIANYQNLVRTKEPVVQIDYVVLTKLGMPVVNLAELKGLKVGILRGDIFSLTLTEQANLDVDMLNSNKSGIFMLMENRIKAFVTNEVTVAVNQDIIPWTKITMSKPVASVTLYHAVNKRHEHLIPQLDKAIRDMKQDGSMKRLLGKLHGIIAE